MRIYLTHCSAKKELAAKASGLAVPPDVLYVSSKTQKFMRMCRQNGVYWAIFSDRYGVWLPHDCHPWYEKNPNRVTDREYAALLTDFERKLADFDAIWFYHNPGRFHRLYRRLLSETALRDRVHLFSHTAEITKEEEALCQDRANGCRNSSRNCR